MCSAEIGVAVVPVTQNTGYVFIPKCANGHARKYEVLVCATLRFTFRRSHSATCLP